MRDFTYDEEQLKSGKNELTKLHTDKEKQFGPLVRSENGKVLHSFIIICGPF